MNNLIVRDLTKTYQLSRSPDPSGLRGFWHLPEKSVHIALREISFSAVPGEAIAVLGRNGSGKSTLLKCLSGVTAPTWGEVTAKGRVSALLELGAGFHPEYTGIENIYLNGAVCGLSRAQVRKQLPEILEFASIGSYVNQPVKTYSDGMFIRLAFAAAIHTRPDILLVDEALAVGDLAFQAKCFQRLKEMQRQGVTILYVTHDIDGARRFCDRGLWLQDGHLQMDGSIGAVSSAYMQSITGGVGGITHTARPDTCLRRFGSHVGAVLQVETPEVWETGREVCVSVTAVIPKEAQLDGLSLSLAVKDRQGLDLMVFSTWEAGCSFTRSDGRVRVQFRFSNPLTPGEYGLAAGLENRDTRPITYYDYAEGIRYIQVVSQRQRLGVFHAPYETELKEE